VSDNPAFLAHRYGIAHTDCWCSRCEYEAKRRLQAAGEMSWIQALGGFMHLCPDCGYKRCPKATDHRLDCSGSNEPGQPGSAYGQAQYYDISELEEP
jgi:hypothetical protein